MRITCWSVLVRSQIMMPSAPSPSTPLRVISEPAFYLSQPYWFDEQLTCRFTHTLLEILLPAYARIRLAGTHMEKMRSCLFTSTLLLRPPNPSPFPSRDPSSRNANQMTPADQAIQACAYRQTLAAHRTWQILPAYQLDFTLNFGFAFKV